MDEKSEKNWRIGSGNERRKKGKRVVRPNLMANKVCDRILLEIVLSALLRRMNRKPIEEKAVRSKSRALKLKNYCLE